MTTLFSVWLYVAAMAPARIAPSEAPSFFADSVAAVAEMDGTADELGVLATFGICEGAGRRDVIGDGGAAVGAWQLRARIVVVAVDPARMGDRRVSRRCTVTRLALFFCVACALANWSADARLDARRLKRRVRR